MCVCRVRACVRVCVYAWGYSIQGPQKGKLYKSSTVCFCADSRLLLLVNIPLNRPVNATTSALLPALSFCTPTISVFFMLICVPSVEMEVYIVIQYNLWLQGSRRSPSLFLCREQYRTVSPFLWSVPEVSTSLSHCLWFIALDHLLCQTIYWGFCFEVL